MALEVMPFEQLLDLDVQATQTAQRITDAGGSPEEAASHDGQAAELRRRLNELTSGSCQRCVLSLRVHELLEAAVAHPAGRKISLNGSVGHAQVRERTGFGAV